MLIIFMSALVFFSATGDVVLAHERRAINNYQVVVGWIVEPALEGQKDGVDLRVTDNTTGQPVLGLEKTLKVEITFVPTGVSKVFDLRTIFRDPGHYTSDLILTDAGVYRMRFFGDLEGTAINETFNSKGGGGGYGDVESTANLQFPQQLPTLRELDGVTRAAQRTVQEAYDRASTATTFAYIGIALGALGTILVGVSLIVSRRKAK